MAPRYPRYTLARSRTAGRLAARVLFTLLGAAGLVVGGVLPWADGVPGTDLAVRALLDGPFERSGRFTATVGFVSVALGLMALFGLVNPTGWLTRLAGVLGISLFTLYAVQVYRAGDTAAGPGAWLTLCGGAAALVGGYCARVFPIITRIAPRRADAGRRGTAG